MGLCYCAIGKWHPGCPNLLIKKSKPAVSHLNPSSDSRKFRGGTQSIAFFGESQIT